MIMLKTIMLVFAFIAIIGLFLALAGMISGKIKLVHWGLGLLLIFGAISVALETVHFLITRLLEII